MSALFLAPSQEGSFVEASGAPGYDPAQLANRLTMDEPALVWIASSASSAYLIVRLDGTTWDTIGILGHNLPRTATITARIGDSPAQVSGSGATMTRTINAWSGDGDPRAYGAITTLAVDENKATFLRLDISNPSGTEAIRISRLLIGRRIEVLGVDQGAELTFKSGSTISDGPGWTSAMEGRTRLNWKISVGNIRSSDNWTRWAPFLNDVGTHKGFLFIPHTTHPNVQQQAALMRCSGDAKTVEIVSNRYKVDVVLLEV